jgi:ribosomal-protein-alanine N-acetyltransferase
MTEAFKIRQFQPDDINSVVVINQQCLPENYPEQFFLGLHYHAPKAFFVAQVDDSVIGYIMCRIERGISGFGRLPTKKGHIVSVAVMHDSRNTGIGTALISAAMKGMQDYGASEVFLEVRKTNEAAIGVYEKLGFSVKRVLRGYYRDGEDAYLMAKKLDGTQEEAEKDD